LSASALASGISWLGRALRERGVPVCVSDEIDAARGLAHLRGADGGETRCALRIALKLRPSDWGRLDEVLDGLLRKCPDAIPDPVGATPTASIDGRRPGRSAPSSGTVVGPAPVTAEPSDRSLPGYSPAALLRQKPFEACTPADLAAMERVLARVAARLATRRSRRLVPDRAGRTPDLRRSLRRAVSTGGELVSIARRARAIEEPRLVFLVDTSGSMDAHARFLLAFVLALRRVARSIEVFVFNTELVRLTGRFGMGAPALDRLAASVPDWSGGTRIGECFGRFVEEHLSARVDRRTVVVVLSDGLDRGEPAELAAAMRAIGARARKIIWLNPLLGDPRYEPTARGMAAALPHVDELLPAHDLASLETLVPRLTA
jgi:uncharacterized protein with von Willebrand factor type A (vWA) domain